METLRFFRPIPPLLSNSRIFKAFHQKPPTSTLNASFCAPQIARELHAIQTPVFEKDFYDRILRRYHSLDTICEYIRQNPYRLLIRRLNPQFFSKTTNITIRDTQLQAYGNLQLLDNPFKAPVVIHRADSEAIRSAKLNHLAESITQPIALTEP